MMPGSDMKGKSRMAHKGKDLSVREVAERWGVSRKTVLGLIKSGELHAYRFGLRAYRVKEEWLEEFCKRRRVIPSYRV
jgi:excisionase family DNA binding protein